METPDLTSVPCNNPSVSEQNFGENVNSFSSPIIPHVQVPQAPIFDGMFTVHEDDDQERIAKVHWIGDYSDDIFHTLRKTELNRRFVCFRSPQVCQRPMLLNVLKKASEKCKLLRTTLHLAVYFLDCFMDHYTIRGDKLLLSAITCLHIAAKIEETDVDIPKFADLNEISGGVYTLNDLRNVERKILSTFDFCLIRPTTATFAEFFANSLITLQDFQIFVNHWNNEIILNNYYQQQQDLQIGNHFGNNELSSFIGLSPPCPYSCYENMLATLSKTFWELIDVSLNYLKFANVRPSIVASACIAAVRQIYGVFPIWTQYLVKITHCTIDMISPFAEAIVSIYRIHYNNEHLQIMQPISQTPVSIAGQTITTTPTILCDSPDSGIVLGNDTKSTTSDSENEDSFVVADDVNTTNEKSCNYASYMIDSDEDEAYYCLEYPRPAKRRRIL